MKKMIRLLSAAAVITLAGCAGQPPVFTPPTERPQALHEMAWPGNKVLVLAYHDVADIEPDQQYVATRTANFVAQMRWLQINHYVPVSINQILAARDGKAKLPDKAVLLTFDDGYRSMYDRVFPILKRYHWPAVFAPVGAWVDTPEGQMVNFSGQPRPRDKFVTWDQVREMSDSGLIEIGAHTQNMHHGVVANPQGNVEPAASSRRYDWKLKRYETLDEFRQRIDHDVTAVSNTIRHVTGKAPRVWIWPYGAASGIALDVVQAHGYQAAMTLEDGLLNVHDLMNVPRVLIANDPEIEDFAASAIQVQETENMRTVRIDLDRLYDPDPAVMEENVGRVVQRLSEIQPSIVFVKGFVTPSSADGRVREVYFPSEVLATKADLFNRVVHQIQSRILRRVYVYAWVPTLSADLGNGETLLVDDYHGHRVRRASPYSADVQRKLRQLYRDMAASVPTLEGIVFDDDILLPESHDAGTVKSQRHALDGLARILIQEVRAIRGGDVKVARVIPTNHYRSVASRQRLADVVAAENAVILRIMPGTKGPDSMDVRARVHDQIAAVKSVPNGLKKTLFEIQRIGSHGEHLSDVKLKAWMVWLANQGVLNMGYTPDDAIKHHPNVHGIAPFFETHWAQ